LSFGILFFRTVKNRLISKFSLFKSLRILGYISECSINWIKDRKICFRFFGGTEFWKFLLNSRKSHFCKPEVKTRKMKVVGLSRKYHQIKARVMLRRKFSYTFLIFWGFLVENCVSMFSRKKYLNFFFNKFMHSEYFLAMSCFFYTPNYPEKSATATPLRQL
jgi:hypothetical protein